MDDYVEGKAVSSNSKAISQPRHGWNAINWADVQKRVFKLQKRIYQASKKGDSKRVHNLQRLLLSSRGAKLLAVRRVSQDNRGKKTAGIDGVKSLKPSDRLHLADNLELPKKASPTRRVYIDKPGRPEKRPLGIPTMHDRACQALVKMALEPEWEAKFEPGSYGFRPGRSTHDAVKNIFMSTRSGHKWILDADISGCFDNIDHNALLSKLNTYPELRRTIRVWLKAGYLDGNVFNRTDKGTPQGGVVSPLLANIALDGLERHIEINLMQGVENPQEWYAKHGPYKRSNRISPKVIRYADDCAPRRRKGVLMT
jgi:RNA-directed DNA polymerase